MVVENKVTNLDVCPLCNSEELDDVDLEKHGKEIIVTTTCADCGASWRDRFEFVERSELQTTPF